MMEGAGSFAMGANGQQQEYGEILPVKAWRHAGGPADCAIRAGRGFGASLLNTKGPLLLDFSCAAAGRNPPLKMRRIVVDMPI